MGVSAHAVVIDNTAGCLNTAGLSHDVTSLTVTGTVDARDLQFVADSLTVLEELDLSQAHIMAYSNPLKPLAGTTFSFPADELPADVLMGTGISTIVLPQDLKSLGQASLAGCRNLTAITLPEGLATIGNYALSSSGIKTITVPETVTSIGVAAFSRCDSLTTVTYAAQQVPDFAFLGAKALSNVTLAGNVTEIGKGAFSGCISLGNINFADDNTVRVINAEAFIGAGAQALNLAQMERLEQIGDWAFATSGIASATLPQNITSMGQGAFFYADRLGSVMLPDELSTIPAYAFAGATALAGNVSLPDGVTGMGDYAFYCDSMVSVFTLPASVEILGSWAMAGMTGLDTVNAEPTVVPALGENVWAGVNQPAVMLNTADNDIADLYAAMDQWKEFHILRNYLLGDVNMDGVIDITDVNTVSSIIVNFEIYGEVNYDAADYNHDGAIDITDLNQIVMAVLDGRHEYVRKAKGRNAQAVNVTSDRATIGDFSIESGETREITINLDNSRAYSALQLDIDMPQGLSIVPGTLSATTRDQRHTVMLSSNADRIMLFSQGVDAIAGNEGAIIKMTVKADEAVQGDITLSNLVLVTPKSERFQGCDSYATVGSATGIDNMNACGDKVYTAGNTLVIEASEAGNAQIVAINGMAQDITVEQGRNETTLAGGVYIVRLAGHSYKVIVK